MAEVLDSRKSEVLQLLQCVICLDGAKVARICPHCSQLFCDECINTWLANQSSSCPYCRSVVSYSEFVKGCSITKLQESIEKLFSTMATGSTDGLCDRHENQQLSLFCYPCEVCICVKCWFSDDHADHKERTVPLEDAFGHFKQNLSAGLPWVNGRKEVVNKELTQVQEHERQLSKEKELIDTICKESEELVTGKATPATLVQIMTTDRKMSELRSNLRNQTESIRLDRRREFMSEPTVLVFRMTEFANILKDRGSCETNLQAPYGFEWKCKIADEDGSLFFYLCLIGGTSGEYSVQFDSEPEEKVYRFELDSAVKIGVYKPATNVDNHQQLTAYIRQTYADRFQQLQDHIARLEKDNAEHVAFRTYLTDWDKRIGPSSG